MKGALVNEFVINDGALLNASGDGGGGGGGDIASSALGALTSIVGGATSLAGAKRNLEAMKQQGKISKKEADAAYKLAQLEYKMADKSIASQKIAAQAAFAQTQQSNKIIIAVVGTFAILIVAGVVGYVIYNRRQTASVAVPI
jgi:hypothetical protein